MPFKSEAQRKKLYSMKGKGELPGVNLHEWSAKTKGKLPEHVSKKKAAVASQAEINVFVKAAMARYAELGIPKDIAEDLFARKMTKIAEQLGMALPQDPNARIVKLATAKLTAKGIPEEQAKVMLTHEFSKQAFIEKVARVKKAVLAHVKKAQTVQDTDLDNALEAKAKVQKKLMPPVKKAQAANATPATLPVAQSVPNANGLPPNAANTPTAIPARKSALPNMGAAIGGKRM